MHCQLEIIVHLLDLIVRFGLFKHELFMEEVLELYQISYIEIFTYELSISKHPEFLG